MRPRATKRQEHQNVANFSGGGGTGMGEVAAHEQAGEVPFQYGAVQHFNAAFRAALLELLLTDVGSALTVGVSSKVGGARPAALELMSLFERLQSISRGPVVGSRETP